jgi:hypothetical protein
MSIKKILTSSFVGIVFSSILALLMMWGVAIAGYPTFGSGAGSLGKVTVDTDVSEWDVGSGQFNGEFVVAERNGIELGLRAQDRFVGPIDVIADRGNRVGVYEALTGLTSGDNNGTWNYDFHVDLRNATGMFAGKTLDDYMLFLEQDFSEQSLFGALGSDPVMLPLEEEPPSGVGVCSADTFDPDGLCQQSWNPGFGNTDFDPDEERTYNLRVVLVPWTFNGPPIAVAIQVIVSD